MINNKRSINKIILLVAVILSSMTAMGQSTAFYVDPVNGDDSKVGTSPATAFKTIEKARNEVRGINSSMSNDIYVYLMGGTHWLTSTLLLNNADGGTNGYNVIYSAYNNEKPVISGGKQMTGWTLYDASKNIYSMCACGGGSLNTRQLFVNGVRANRASGALPTTTYVKSTGYTGAANLYTGSSGIPMHQWANQTDIEFVYKCGWTSPRISPSSITSDGTTTTITMKQPAWNNGNNKGYTSIGGTTNTSGKPAFIENAYELLDAPGEWYLDKATDSLFYKPRSGEDLSTANVIVPVLEELVKIEGSAKNNKVGNIQFKGITFSYATELYANGDGGYISAQNNVVDSWSSTRLTSILKAAVSLKYADSIRFERDVFEHLGGTGLNMYAGCQDNLVIGSVFSDISGGGIQVGDYNRESTSGEDNYIQNPDPDVWMRNNDIYNNYITNIGVEYYSATAIAASLPVDMDIVHNELGQLPYTGIHTGWGFGLTNTIEKNNKIQYNFIHDAMLTLYDGGMIYHMGYTAGDAANKTIVSNNYVLNDMNIEGALYADGFTNWTDWTNNVVNNASRFFMGNDISNITVSSTWSTTGTYLSNRTGTGVSIAPATVVSNNAWPTAAQNIIAEAGLENAYLDIKPLSTTAPTQVLFQQFNGETTGSGPLNWTLSPNGGTIQIAEIPSATNKSIKLNKTTTTTGSMSSSKTFYPLTLGSVELKARAEQINANCYISWLADEAGITVAAVEFKPNGKIGYLKNGQWLDTDVSYAAGTWYSIKIIFNSNTDTYDLYIDGVQKLDNEPFMAAGGKINKVTNGIYKDNIGTMYEDDLDVYALLSEPTQLVFQNFNTETTGSAPANWSIGANGGTVQIAEIPSTADKSMRLAKTSTSGSSMSASRTFTAATSGSVELSARAQQTNAYCYIAILSDAANNVLAGVTFKNNGKIAYWKSDGSWQDTSISYTVGTWYKVKVVFNSNTDKSDLYVDGTKVIDQMPSMAATGTGDIVKLGPGIYSGSIGTMYLDNVEVTKY